MDLKNFPASELELQRGGISSDLQCLNEGGGVGFDYVMWGRFGFDYGGGGGGGGSLDYVIRGGGGGS